MKLFVYGLLKRGYRLNRYLSTAKFEGEKVIHGFKLYNFGCPVMVPDPDSSVFGEIYSVDERSEYMNEIDRIESMYNRLEVEPELYAYVFYKEINPLWNRECDKNEAGHYVFESDRG